MKRAVQNERSIALLILLQAKCEAKQNDSFCCVERYNNNNYIYIYKINTRAHVPHAHRGCLFIISLNNIGKSRYKKKSRTKKIRL